MRGTRADVLTAGNARRFALLKWACFALLVGMYVGFWNCDQSKVEAKDTGNKSVSYSPRGDLYGLVVGISHHKDGQIPELQSAASDADEIARFLKSQHTLFKNIHVRLLLNSRATRANIERVLAQGTRLAGSNDVLLFYFVGYGMPDPARERGYFLTAYDTESNRVPETGLICNLKDLLKNIKARQCIAVLDTCSPAEREKVPLREVVRTLRDTVERVVIVSGRTLTTGADDSQRQRRSLFTKSFLEGLRGTADADRDGIVSAEESYEYAASQTRIQSGGSQIPEWEGRFVQCCPLACTVAAKRPPAPIRRDPKGDLYCLAVGVSRYRYSGVPDLEFAAKDAGDLAEIMQSQRHLYGRVFVTVLKNELATKVNIEKALSGGFARARPDDTLLLFVSGHGVTQSKKGDEFFLVAHDTDPGRLSATAVPLGGMWLIGKVKAQRALVIADTCHAGAAVELREHSRGVSFADFAREFVNTGNRLIMSSSRTSEASQEDGLLGNGIFTHFILKGLRCEADSDGNGVVTVREVFEYAAKHTNRFTGGHQNPEFEGRMDGEFPLSRVQSPKRP